LQGVLTGLQSELDLQAVLESILVQLEKVVRYDSASIFLQQEDRLVVSALRGFAQPEELLDHSYPIEGDEVFQELCHTCRPLVLNDVQATGRLLGYGGTEDIQSWMGVPLVIGGEVAGCLTIDSFTRGAYSEPELVDLAQAFASHAAVAIENARLFKTEQEQRRIAEGLREVGVMLSTTLDFERVLDLLLDQIGRVIPYDLVDILISDGEHHLQIVRTRLSEKADPAVATWLEDAHFEIAELPNLDEMISSTHPMVIPDVSTHPGWVAKSSLPPRSWAGAPVFLNDRMVICYSLYKFQSGFYNGRQSDLLSVFAAQTALALQNARLFGEVQQLAIIDDLTGLFNRRHLYDLGTREFNRSRRFSRSLAVLMLDLDLFRNVNDEYGHLVGDEVLKSVADLCRASIRVVDVIGRYGGDEFTIVCPEADLEGARIVAERLRSQIARMPFATQAGLINITASIGIAMRTDESQGIASLVEVADKAMYQAKHDGRNLVRSYQDLNTRG
jgi:eukaryotic-like serine/threonine-protein kinase